MPLPLFPYESLLIDKNFSIAETPHPYLFLREKHIQAAWLEQKYFIPLKTSDGKEIVILSPGIWNSESGPDFLKAHIKIEGKELRGDIEIHLNEESWYHHKHHENSDYNQVILHIVFWEPKQKRLTVNKAGQIIPCIYLEQHLTCNINEILRKIDLDLYPYKQFLGTGKCSQKLFHCLSEEKLISLFSSASIWRLKQKKELLSRYSNDLSKQIAIGIALALGYKQNAEEFLELFLYLLQLRDLPLQKLFAISLGVSGFFEEKCQKQWKDSLYYKELKEIWEGDRYEISHNSKIRTNQVRPINHPVRRLVYLCYFLKDPLIDYFDQFLINIWEAYQKETSGKKSTSKTIQLLLSLIPNYQDAYWNSHYTFEKNTQSQFLTLMGDSLKKEILVNTILPILYHYFSSTFFHFEKAQNELEKILSIYPLIPASTTSKSVYLKHRFFGERNERKLLEKMQMQQGAYQLHKDFCIHYEGSCEGCPFVERYLDI